MDAELRELFQAELHQIRDWLDDFIEDELQVAPEFECSILQAERDPVVGLDGRVATSGNRYRSGRMSMVAASMPIQSRHLSFDARDGQSLKRPYQARIGATKPGRP